MIDKIVKELGLVKPKPEQKPEPEETIERNERGQITHYKDSDGYERWYEYDSDGNEIHSKDSDGYEYWSEYDSDGNLIHFKDSDGYEYWYEYDSDGNVTKELKIVDGVYYLNGERMERKPSATEPEKGAE